MTEKPTRREAEDLLCRYRATDDNPRLGSLHNQLLYLICGPKPPGLTIEFVEHYRCREGDCAACPAMVINSGSLESNIIGVVCTHMCHKEDE